VTQAVPERAAGGHAVPPAAAMAQMLAGFQVLPQARPGAFAPVRPGRNAPAVTRTCLVTAGAMLPHG